VTYAGIVLEGESANHRKTTFAGDMPAKGNPMNSTGRGDEEGNRWTRFYSQVKQIIKNG